MKTAPPLMRSSLPPGVDLPERAQVVVIGASLAGLGMARRLAAAGVEVVVLERRQQLGHGVEGRDPGVLTGGLPEHPWRLAAAIGEAKTKLIYSLTSRGIAMAAPDGGQAVTHAAIDEREVEEIRKSADALEAMGLSVRRLDAAATCAALDGEGFTAGMQIEGEVATDTQAVLERVARETWQAGARWVTEARVEWLGSDADGPTVRVNDRIIQADAVILADDHHMRDAVPWLADKLVPVREHALRIPVQAPLAPARAQHGYVTWRTDSESAIRISGCRWATQHLEVFETDEVPLPAVTDKLVGFARRHLGTGDATPTHAWARILTATCDGLPILGPMPGDPTTVCCLGFQGFAPAMALAAAEDVAAGLLTGTAPLPDWLSPRRFL